MPLRWQIHFGKSRKPSPSNLLALNGQPAPRFAMSESEQKSRRWFRIGETIILLLLLGFLVWAVIPKSICACTSQENACINNLRQIDAAINEWALEKGKTNGTVVIEEEIKPYIKLDTNGNLPKCPAGGKYTYGKVGDIPQITCSLSTANPPHVLP